MQVINLHHPYQATKIVQAPIVLAMGFFDGVHVGHRAVIARAQAEAKARGVKLAVLTYDQHASVVFEKHGNPLQYLTTLPRKLELFAELGVDITYVVNFTSAFAKLEPQAFVDQYMAGLNAVAVVAGFDHTYGPKDQANMTNLPTYAAGRFEVIEVPAVLLAGVESASRQARQLVDDGKIEQLNQMLTIPYQTSGVIVHGDARGRELGYPTLNIETTSGERLPAGGVYVTSVQIDGVWYQGMGQIGYNVTFGAGRAQTVEINVFNFNQEVYGERVRVNWHQYLRGEVKFTGVEALIAQLQNDQAAAQLFFATQNIEE
ncbi:MAG: riboflavin biosynthesis protein RibF [Lactobacillaceae bacterium]|jgi:riboflavin kinase/FMN adenylyltransferase|nr:riboflavin biosynthesis protein RibF [Lactobacillaceae bacterium]